MKVRLSLAVAAAVVLLDQLTKHWALNALADGNIVDVVGSLRFNLAFNTGMAFSRGTGWGPIIGVVALVVVVALLVSVGRATSRWYPWAVGLVVGGAVGNIVDRLFRGRGWLRGGVVDFIDVQWWPIFNVADIAVTVGAALLLLTTLWAPSRPPAGQSAGRPAEASTTGEQDDTPPAGDSGPLDEDASPAQPGVAESTE